MCVCFPLSCLLQCLHNELRMHLPTFLIDPEQHGPLPVGIGKFIYTTVYIADSGHNLRLLEGLWRCRPSLVKVSKLLSCLLQRWCWTPWWTPCLFYAAVGSTRPSLSSSSPSSSISSAPGSSTNWWAQRPTLLACAPTTGELLSARGSWPSKPGRRGRAWSWLLTATSDTLSRSGPRQRYMSEYW